VQVANSSETLITTKLRGVTSEKPAGLGKLILREEKFPTNRNYKQKKNHRRVLLYLPLVLPCCFSYSSFLNFQTNNVTRAGKPLVLEVRRLFDI